MRIVGARSTARLAVVLPALLLAFACGPSAEKKQASSSETAAPAADQGAKAKGAKGKKGAGKEKAAVASEDGTSTTVATPAASSDGMWMADIPAVVPHFAHGTALREPKRSDKGNGAVWRLHYDGVTQKQADAYLAELKKAGFSAQRKKLKKGGFGAGGNLTQGSDTVDYILRFQPGGRVDLIVRLTHSA